MENIFEILVPLIFAAIYFFGNMMSKKEADSPPSKRQRPTEEEEAIQARQRRFKRPSGEKFSSGEVGQRLPSEAPQSERPGGYPRRPEPRPEPVSSVPPEPEVVTSSPVAGRLFLGLFGERLSERR